MREQSFEIDGSTYFLHEGPDLHVNGKAVTEWEVRKLCTDEFGHEYYHQLANAHIARRATAAQRRDHIARYYVRTERQDDAWAA